MLEPPALSDDDLLGALRDGYGRPARRLTFLPLGCDAAAAVYRVEAADGRDYFLKARRDGVNQAGLRVPAYLREQGLQEVVAPERTLAGGLWQPLGEWALILYPFLHAARPLPSGQAEAAWRRFGTLLRQVHDTHLPPELKALLPRERFEPATALVRSLDAQVASQAATGGTARALAAAWHAHRPAILAICAAAEARGQRLRDRQPARLGLCHADPHWDNVLLDGAGRLWLVDWDDTLLALKERDLMFVIGGITDDWATAEDTARCLKGYGPAGIDAAALAYYRADWAAQDIGEFAQQALAESGAGEATRRDAVRLFAGLFGPGQIVEKALG